MDRFVDIDWRQRAAQVTDGSMVAYPAVNLGLCVKVSLLESPSNNGLQLIGLSCAEFEVSFVCAVVLS